MARDDGDAALVRLLRGAEAAWARRLAAGCEDEGVDEGADEEEEEVDDDDDDDDEAEEEGEAEDAEGGAQAGVEVHGELIAR